MKGKLLSLALSLGIVSISWAGPANSIVVGSGKDGGTLIKNSVIKNKSEISGSSITNRGENQKNIINSIKIRKNTRISNSKIENDAKMSGSQITNIGRNQVNVIGGIDIGGE